MKNSTRLIVVTLCALLCVGTEGWDEGMKSLSGGGFPSKTKGNERADGCGEHLTWSISEGVLTITGTGRMLNFSRGGAPWYSSRFSINSIVIEEGVTSIGDNGFYACPKLLSVSISSTVTTIGESAFESCRVLPNITIPRNVESIAYKAFFFCGSLESIEVEKENTHFKSMDGVLYDRDGTVLVTYPIGNTRPTYVIPDGVKSIEDYAFYYSPFLTSIHLPDSLVSVGSQAFFFCEMLTSVTIPSNVSHIGYAAFTYSPQLTSIQVDEKNAHFKSVDDVLFNHNLTVLITYPAGNGQPTFTVPEGVTVIGSFAFGYSRNLKTINLPIGLVSIQDHAIQSCDKLESITIPDSVSFVGVDAFASCTSLESAALPEGILSVEDSVFNGCSSLNSIVIPNSVRSIGSMAFLGCKQLKRVIIPDGVTMIGNEAFESCSSLTEVIIPGSVMSVGNYSFSSCESLTNLTIKEGVERIESRAFNDCKQLHFVSIPDSVSSIGDNAFHNCIGLESVSIPDGVISIGNGAFSSCTNLVSVFYQGSHAVSEIFSDCDALKLVCVSPDYNSSSFGGVSVNYSDSCDTFRNLFNHCFKATFEEGTFIQSKRKNATEWEDQTNGCVQYRCNNESGKTGSGLCNSVDGVSQMCYNNSQCVEKKKITEGKSVIVEIDLDDVDIVEFNVSNVLDDIILLTGIEMNETNIAYEVDKNGKIVSLFLVLSDEDVANSIVTQIDKLDKGDQCKYRTLRSVKRICIFNKENTFLSGGYQAMIDIVLILGVFAIAIGA